MNPSAASLSAPVDFDLTPIQFADVAAAYGKGDVAVREITCRFEHGTSTALVGPNGSGKTTVLRLLSGLAQPSQGAITPSPANKSVALVPQQHGLRAWLPLTVSDVLRMSRFRDRGLIKRFGPADRDIVKDAAERMEVIDLVNRQFGQLSGGQRQRVMVAQALAHKADVLLMDEPITGLDMPSQETILQVIDEERGRGRIVVISTHHMDEAEHCDQVVLLANRMVAVGAPRRVLTNKNLQETFGLRMAYGDREDCVFHGEHDSHRGGVPHVFDDHGHAGR